MSGPSEKALVAAWNNAEIEHTGQANIDRALRAAHGPALGLDRSVCLRDVVRALDAKALEIDRRDRSVYLAVARFIEAQFGRPPGRAEGEG